MAGLATTSNLPTSTHHGLRMTAREYFELPDDGIRYELIDGVVIMSPSPTPRHQAVAMRIALQLGNHVEKNDLGEVLCETDVFLGKGPSGRDLVYRPDVIYIRQERMAKMWQRIVEPPDVVVEVLSPLSGRIDHRTKKDDYERCGVGEYWIVDPENETFTFYRLDQGRFVEVSAKGDTFRSEVVVGFDLDLARLRETFKRW